MTDRELAAELHDQLAATEELPIDSRANRWLGEAQAVADDIRGDVSEDVRRTGAGQVLNLLDSIEDTGHDRADEHVERARLLAEELTQA